MATQQNTPPENDEQSQLSKYTQHAEQWPSNTKPNPEHSKCEPRTTNSLTSPQHTSDAEPVLDPPKKQWIPDSGGTSVSDERDQEPILPPGFEPFFELTAQLLNPTTPQPKRSLPTTTGSHTSELGLNQKQDHKPEPYRIYLSTLPRRSTYLHCPSTNRVKLEVEMERDVFCVARANMYRVRIFPLAPVNVPTQNQMQSTYIRGNATMMANTSMASLISPNPLQVYPMKIIAWNCRGAASDAFFTNARNLINIFQSHVFIVMETKLPIDRAEGIANRLFV